MSLLHRFRRYYRTRPAGSASEDFAFRNYEQSRLAPVNLESMNEAGGEDEEVGGPVTKIWDELPREGVAGFVNAPMQIGSLCDLHGALRR